MKIECIYLTNSSDNCAWVKKISRFECVDACQTPEYYKAYISKKPENKALLWYANDHTYEFCYPFILSPVTTEPNCPLQLFSGFFDISSVYGYGGAFVNKKSVEFILHAWQAFDKWAKQEKIIAEFNRFSPFSSNHLLAHPETIIEKNRILAISLLPDTHEKLWSALSSKTRNMIRKAERFGLTVREVELTSYLKAFRDLYKGTVEKNQASSFFYYDDVYFEELLKIDSQKLKCFAAFYGDKMVSAVIAILFNHYALYHLGATDYHFSSHGAGNLALWHTSTVLIDNGVKYFNLGGGRTTAPDDSLLKFKLSNATDFTQFYIGKRVINSTVYNDMLARWESVLGEKADVSNLLFYRK